MKCPPRNSSLYVVPRSLPVIIALLFALASLAVAQDLDTVTITGRVTDQNGAIIPGATVEAVLIKSGLSRKAITNDEGRFRLIQLEPGTYTLRYSASGFATQEKTDLALVSGQNAQFEVVLLPQG